MSQTIAVLTHIKKFKSITPMDALNAYGCFRLAARIQDLRDQGHRIQTEIVRSGDKRYARYSLIKKAPRKGLPATQKGRH